MKQAEKRRNKALKRKQKLLQRKQNQVMRNQISTGEVNMYHFTGRKCIEGIKKYGLCMGDVIINSSGRGKNAVNLTEENHYHDPSCNGLQNAEIRIKVRLNTKDCVNAKRHAKERGLLWIHDINEGNVAKHWYYFGQIKTEDFLDVSLWNGKEYVSVELNDIEDNRVKKGFFFKKTPVSVVQKIRLWGNLHYDKSGVAIKASDSLITSDKDKALYALTDAVNETLKDTHLHDIWTEELIKFERQGNFYGRMIGYAVQLLLEHNIEIPNIYLNSEFEQKYQFVEKISEHLGLGLRQVA